MNEEVLEVDVRQELYRKVGAIRLGSLIANLYASILHLNN